MSKKTQIHTHQNILSALCLLSFLFLFSTHTQSKPYSDKVPEKGLTFSSPLIVRWQFDSKNTTSLSPTSNKGQLYLPLTSGEIVSLDVSNGQLLWRTEIGGDFSASPIADERGVYLASRNGDPDNSRQILRSTGAIRALSQSTGITLWMRTLHFPIQGGLVSSATKLFGGSKDGRVYAFNKATGEILWMLQHTSAFSSSPALHNRRLYIGSEDGTLLAIDEATGAILWRYRTRGALRGTVAVADNTIFFGSSDGYVYAYSEISGRLLWRRRTGAAVQAVVLAGSGIVVTSLDNFAYLLSPRRGELIWKRQLAGRIAALPLIDTQSALFAPLGGDACIVLSLRDGKQLNTLPVGEEGNTGATPLVAENLLLIPTRRGLTAFAPSLSDSSP
jgi:outer membrane protein assembly factor BamB